MSLYYKVMGVASSYWLYQPGKLTQKFLPKKEQIRTKRHGVKVSKKHPKSLI